MSTGTVKVAVYIPVTESIDPGWNRTHFAQSVVGELRRYFEPRYEDTVLSVGHVATYENRVPVMEKVFVSVRETNKEVRSVTRELHDHIMTLLKSEGYTSMITVHMSRVS